MNRSDVDWKGFWVATPTPYSDDMGLKLDAISPLINWYLQEGCTGFLCNGTTGEWFSQSSIERRLVAEAYVKAVSGRAPLIVGCTAFTADEAIELARHAASIGADGIMSTPPPYAQLTDDEVFEYFSVISQATTLPFLVYNWPIGTSLDISPDLAARLVSLPNVVAFKESTPDTEKALKVLAAVVSESRVFMNFRSSAGLAAYHSVGGDGFIGGGALLGHVEVEFFDALEEGDVQRATGLMHRISALYGALFNTDWSGRHGSPQATLKAAMRLQGLDAGVPRPPLLTITGTEQVSAIARALREADALNLIPSLASIHAKESARVASQ